MSSGAINSCSSTAPARPLHPGNPGVGRWSAARSAAGEHNPWLVAGVLSIATFMEVLDTSIANVSLRHIAGSLAASTDESTWVITSYLVANAIILPISGFLANVVGRKRFYMMCVLLFTLSSLLCGMAMSLGWLIFFRVLQGLGGGGLVPSEQAMLADTFPPEKRGQAFALYGVAVVVAPTLGPTLGGWITDSFSWHWIFLINVPVGLLSLILCGRYVHEPPTLVQERKALWKRGLRIDYIGFALVALGLACLELTLSNGERYDWFNSSFVRTAAIVSGLALLALVFWEWRIPEPVVDVRLVGTRNFGLSILMMFAVGFVLFSSTTQLPILLQGSHGYTALTAGLVLTPGGVATFICMPLVGLLTRKVQLRYLAAAGLLIQSLAMYHMSRFPADVSYGHAMWARVFQATGIGFLFIPINTLSYHGLPANKNNVASSMLSVARNIGASVGIALANTVLLHRMQYHHSVLAERINPYSPGAREALANIQTRMESAGSADPAATAQALGAIDMSINRQASIMAFNDVAWLLAVVVAGMILFVPLLDPVKAERGGGGH